MLVKCESKSHRVKGVSFHPRLSWVLASLHNGVIQLWDYRLSCMIGKFDEHNGPVRGVNFHTTQTLFVSGGDDHCIKVWDYKEKHSLFTLHGHLDYIRTVQFHPEYPWICSAADDQTIRIWNWQSRHCIAVLAGHHHYVMCATFHPTDDLLASASLDQTIRIWDLSGLREKTVASSTRPGAMRGFAGAPGVAAGVPSDIFGATDAVSKFILEGHDRGVNWVAFHPNAQMLVSAADDRLIKLWRYDDVKWWEVDTLRGHFNNVSCVAFHPLKDIVVSNSEDRTIRIWDLSRRVLLHTYRRDNDRFWVLGTQLNSNLLAVGHDSGMVVFKLDRERPPAASWVNGQTLSLLHIRNNVLHIQPDAFKNAIPSRLASSSTDSADPRNAPEEIELASNLVRRRPDPMAGAAVEMYRNPYNSAETNVAILYKANGGSGDVKWSYDLHTLSVPANQLALAGGGANYSVRTETGTCNAFAFCGRNRYATVDGQGNIFIHTMAGSGGELKKKFDPPETSTTTTVVTASMTGAGNGTKSSETASGGIPGTPSALFPAGNNKVMVRTDEMLIVYDIVARKKLGEINTGLASVSGANGRIRRVVWNPTGQLCALLSKLYVILVNSNMEHLATQQEHIKVKSGAWDEHDVFIYNTVSHIKYLLPNGDNGILKSTVTSGTYIQACNKGNLVFLNYHSSLRQTRIKTGEELMKVALDKGNMEAVALLLRQNVARGNALVGYLTQKGFPEVAYHCVEEPSVQAMLALQYGDLAAATQAIAEVNQPKAWTQLGEVAMKLGTVSLAEQAFQKSKRYCRLVHLYTVTGNLGKAEKLGKLLKTIGDESSAFHLTLITGDVEERVHLLEDQKKYTLAYILAKRHGLKEQATRIAQKRLQPEQVTKLDTAIDSLPQEGRLLCPPMPLMKDTAPGALDWPLRPLSVSEHTASFASLVQSAAQNRTADAGQMITKEKRVLQKETGLFRGTDGGQNGLSVEAIGLDGAAAAIDSAAWEGEDDDWFGEGENAGDDNAGAAVTTVAAVGSGASVSRHGAAGDTAVGEYITRGPSLETRCLSASCSVGDYVALGQFQEAFRLLDKKIGLTNPQLLLPIFKAAFQAAQSYMPTLPILGGVRFPLLEHATEGRMVDGFEIRKIASCEFISELVKGGVSLFGSKKLVESQAAFRRCLLFLTCARASSATEQSLLQDWMNTCRNYLLAIKLEVARREVEPGSKQDLEIAILASDCELQLAHRFLLLKEASRVAVKSQNYVTAAALCRKIMNGEFVAKLESQFGGDLERIRKVLIQCEQRGTNAVELDIDPAQPSDKRRCCTSSLTQITVADLSIICNFCRGESKSSYKGTPCSLCQISILGKQTLGFEFRTVTH